MFALGALKDRAAAALAARAQKIGLRGLQLEGAPEAVRKGYPLLLAVEKALERYADAAAELLDGLRFMRKNIEGLSEGVLVFCTDVSALGPVAAPAPPAAAQKQQAAVEGGTADDAAPPPAVGRADDAAKDADADADAEAKPKPKPDPAAAARAAAAASSAELGALETAALHQRGAAATALDTDRLVAELEAKPVNNVSQEHFQRIGG